MKVLLVFVLLLAGCSTGLDPNYTAYLTAQQAASAARNTRLEALGRAAQNTSPEVAAAAVMAIALDGGGKSGSDIQPPVARNSQALGWATLLLNTGLSAFGIHVNKQIQVHGQDTSVSLENIRYRMMGDLAGASGGNTTNTFTFGDGSSGIVAVTVIALSSAVSIRVRLVVVVFHNALQTA